MNCLPVGDDARQFTFLNEWILGLTGYPSSIFDLKIVLTQKCQEPTRTRFPRLDISEDEEVWFQLGPPYLLGTVGTVPGDHSASRGP